MQEFFLASGARLTIFFLPGLSEGTGRLHAILALSAINNLSF